MLESAIHKCMVQGMDNNSMVAAVKCNVSCVALAQYLMQYGMHRA